MPIQLPCGCFEGEECLECQAVASEAQRAAREALRDAVEAPR